MAPHPTPSAPDSAHDEVVAHARFVRALAGELARDAEEADELAARVMAEAITRRPDPGPGLRIWLRTVVHRMFRRARRDDERRGRRETAAARSESQPDTVELVAEMELQRSIGEAFDALDEPIKSTLFRRYFHDETPTAIASESGVPLATVKSRLQRGLQQLRLRLDDRHRGDRGAWRALAVALSIRGAPIVATKSIVVSSAAAALLVVGATIWSVASRSPSTNESMATSSERSGAPGRRSEANEGTDARRSELPATAALRATESAAAGALPFASGVVVDEHDAPLAGVRVVTGTLQRFHGEVATLEAIDDWLLDERTLARSDATGRFVVGDPADGLAVLYFVRDGFLPGIVDDLTLERASNQERRVALHSGRLFSGDVVDGEGRPIPEARLLVTLGGFARETRIAKCLKDAPDFTIDSKLPQRWQEVDERGRFNFAVPDTGAIHLWQTTPGYRWGASQDFTPTDAPHFVLRRESILLDVTAAEDGKPIRDASLFVRDTETHAVIETRSRTNTPGDDRRQVAGRLSIPLGDADFERSVPHWVKGSEGRTLALTVLAPGRRTATLEFPFRRHDEPPHLSIALEAGDDPLSIRGTVVGAADAKVSFAWAPPPTAGISFGTLPPIAITSTSSDGSFAVRGLPDGDYRVTVSAPGFTRAWRDVTAPCSDLSIELVRTASLVARVVDAAGAPRPGLMVHVETIDTDAAWLVACDGEGVARFDELPATPLFVVAGEKFLYDSLTNTPHPLGDKYFESSDVQHVAPGETKEITLVAPRRLPVRLRVVDEDDSPLARVSIDVCPTIQSGPVMRIKMATRESIVETIATDGAGRAELSWWPGNYDLGFERDGLLYYTRIEVKDSRAGDGATEIVWRVPPQRRLGKLRGRIVDSATEIPIAYCSVTLLLLRDGEQVACSDWGSGYAAQPRKIHTDADGAFEFDGIPVGAASVVCSSEEFGEPIAVAPRFARIRQNVTIAEGNQTLALRAIRSDPPPDGAPAVRIRIQVVDSATKSPLENVTVLLEGLDGDTSHELGFLKTDARGEINRNAIPFSRYRVRTFGPFSTRPPAIVTHGHFTAEVAPSGGLLDVRCEIPRRAPGSRE